MRPKNDPNAPKITMYRRHDKLPQLLAVMRCASRADILFWADKAPSRDETPDYLLTAFCGDCDDRDGWRSAKVTAGLCWRADQVDKVIDNGSPV